MEGRAMPNAPKYQARVEVANTYYYDSLFCFYYIKHFNIFKTLSVRYESSTGYKESTRMQHSNDFLKQVIISFLDIINKTFEEFLP